MFDGLVDIGVGYFNNMGKQESVHLPEKVWIPPLASKR